MRGLRITAVLMVLTLAPGQKAVVHAGNRSIPRVAQRPAPTSPATSSLAIPGGGRILFSVEEGIGVLDADGSQTRFGNWKAVDAYWDPIHPGDILVNPYTNGPPRLRHYHRTDQGWQPIRMWSAGYGPSTQISSDGRWFAYDVSVRGKATGAIRVRGRTGVVASLDGRRLSTISWTPDARVILGHWDGSGLLLWDPFGGALRRISLARHLASKLPPIARQGHLDDSRLSWSSDGRFFAAPAHWREHNRFRGGVALGSLAGGISRIIPTGRAWGAPTWSPVRPEIAFVSSSRYEDPAAALYVYNVSTGQLMLVRRAVPDPYWVAWSPAGDWMLLDDAERGRWLFVSKDGTKAVAYPWLGSYPRWAGPGFSLHIFAC